MTWSLYDVGTKGQQGRGRPGQQSADPEGPGVSSDQDQDGPKTIMGYIVCWKKRLAQGSTMQPQLLFQPLISCGIRTLNEK